MRVYRRTTPGDLTSTFQQVVYLQATDSVSGDSFGAGMSISGDTMVVGASGHDSVIGSTQQSDSGAAYVFRRNTPGDPTSTWTEVVKLTASDGVASGRFGKLVSLDGDTVAIAATKDERLPRRGRLRLHAQLARRTHLQLDAGCEAHPEALTRQSPVGQTMAVSVSTLRSTATRWWLARDMTMTWDTELVPHTCTCAKHPAS